MKYLHLILCSLLLISSFFVVSTKNPIESVLFLILTFCNAASILFLFKSEFLGLIFIIVYVGAVAVLFLFVIMMLNVKSSFISVDFNSKVSYIIGFVLFYFLSYFTFTFLQKSFGIDEEFLLLDIFNQVGIFDGLNNIDVMGQVIYNYFLICFLIAGLILLIALIGSVSLTLRFNRVQKTQIPFRQLSRSDNFLTFFK